MTDKKNDQMNFELTEEAKQKLLEFSESNGLKIGVALKTKVSQEDNLLMIVGGVDFFMVEDDELFNEIGRRLARELSRFINFALPKIINEVTEHDPETCPNCKKIRENNHQSETNITDGNKTLH